MSLPKRHEEFINTRTPHSLLCYIILFSLSVLVIPSLMTSPYTIRDKHSLTPILSNSLSFSHSDSLSQIGFGFWYCFEFFVMAVGGCCGDGRMGSLMVGIS